MTTIEATIEGLTLAIEWRDGANPGRRISTVGAEPWVFDQESPKDSACTIAGPFGDLVWARTDYGDTITLPYDAGSHTEYWFTGDGATFLATARRLLAGESSRAIHESA